MCKRSILLHSALIATLSFTTPIATATDHVLIMTIGNYQNIKPLGGPNLDSETAKKLAQKLGYDTNNATIYKNNQLTSNGMRTALQRLVTSVQPNDRVFIYYSGHGYSLPKINQCTQGLIAQDFNPTANVPLASNPGLFSSEEFSSYMNQIKGKVSDALIILDACHASGNRDMAITRGFSSKDKDSDLEPLQVKAWTPEKGENCQVPVNELAKTWTPSPTRGMLNPEMNFAFISAANEREVALDDRNKGGLATLGLLACAEKGVATNNGQVTVQDLAACSQQQVAQAIQKINEKSPDKHYLPQTIEVFGNPQRAYGNIRPIISNSTVSISQGDDSKVRNILNTFNTIQANTNFSYWGFDVIPSQNTVPLGKDISLNYKSNHPGYGYLLYVGSDGKDIQQLWPDKGQHIQLPATSSGVLLPSITLTAPSGMNTFLAILSDTPMDWAPVLNGDSTPINAQVLQQLSCVTNNGRNAFVKSSSNNSICNVNRNVVVNKTLSLSGTQGAGYAGRIIQVEGR